MKVYFKGSTESYNVDEPAIFTFCKNETLDSGKIRISNVPAEKRLILQPFDLVKFDETRLTGEDIYMLVDTVTETITCLNPKIYSYEIDIFSETKVLENIVLPNLKITRNLDDPKSVKYYLSTYLSSYGEEIRVGMNSSFYTYVLKYTFSQAVNQKFDAIECPEMQWNQPTLREVLNDLMMVGDCIPVIKHIKTDTEEYKIIDYMDLTEKGKDVSTQTNNINYIQSSRSSEDYVSELYMNLVNVTNTDINQEQTRVVVNKYRLFTSNTSFVTTDNAVIKTQYPIYKIKSLKVAIPYDVNIPGQSGTYPTVYIEYDLTHLKLDGTNTYLNFVYEAQQWQLLEENYDATFNEAFNQWPKYRETTLLYTRGSDTIEGFSRVAKKWLINKSYWTEMAKELFTNCKSSALVGTPLEGVNITVNSYHNAYQASYFTIEYETLVGSVFKASKKDSPNNKRVVIDNQTNSYIDSYNTGFLEYQKANRLGNKQLMINARYENEDLESDNPIEMIKIGDYYDDSIVYQVQYQVFANHIEVNAYATKDYILRNYFTGVKSKIRSWIVASAGEALTRHDIYKLYLEFSYSEHIERSDYIEDTNTEYFLSPLYPDTAKPLRAVCFRTLGSDWYPTGGSYLYAIDLVNRIVGDSLVFTFGLKDNVLVDKYITGTSLIDNYSGLTTDNYRYADEHGEFTRIEYQLVSSIDSVIPLGDYPVGINVFNTLKPRPKIGSDEILDGDVYFKRKLEIYKDSQEITYISTQIEFCSDTSDIAIGRKFLEDQLAVKTTDNISRPDYKSGPSSDYDFRNPQLPDGSSEGTVSDIYFSGNSVTLRLTPTGSIGMSQEEALAYATELLENKTLYIYRDNSLLLALNNVPLETNVATVHYGANFLPVIEIYLNPLKDRNKDIYSSRSSDKPSPYSI